MIFHTFQLITLEPVKIIGDLKYQTEKKEECPVTTFEIKDEDPEKVFEKIVFISAQIIAKVVCDTKYPDDKYKEKKWKEYDDLITNLKIPKLFNNNMLNKEGFPINNC